MIFLLAPTISFASDIETSRFVSVCTQIQNENMHDVSSDEYTLFIELKKQYYLDDCNYLWLYLNKQESILIQNVSIGDFRLLSNLETLRYLSLNNNLIQDSASLPNLPQLRYLNLSNNKLTDFKGIPDYPNLTVLRASDNQITSIESLRGLRSLEVLDLTNNAIESLWPLTELVEIQELFADNNQTSNILPILYLPEIRTLSLEQNPIRFCPRGAWTRVQNQTLEMTPFLQSFCINQRKQELKSLVSFRSGHDKQPE
jgi:hypothetical protein